MVSGSSTSTSKIRRPHKRSVACAAQHNNDKSTTRFADPPPMVATVHDMPRSSSIGRAVPRRPRPGGHSMARCASAKPGCHQDGRVARGGRKCTNAGSCGGVNEGDEVEHEEVAGPEGLSGTVQVVRVEQRPFDGVHVLQQGLNRDDPVVCRESARATSVTDRAGGECVLPCGRCVAIVTRAAGSAAMRGSALSAARSALRSSPAAWYASRTRSVSPEWASWRA